MRRDHAQHARLAVVFEVDAGDEPLAEQERQHVVAVHAFGRRGVDFEPEIEVEELAGARAFPDQRVERRQQRAGLDPARDARARQKVARSAKVRHADSLQFAGIDEFGDARARVGEVEAKVIAQVAFGRDAERARGDADQLALGIGLGGCGSVQHCRREDAFREVVDALETLAPGGRDLAAPKERLEADLHVAPAPPGAGAAGALEAAGRQRPAPLDLVAQPFEERPFLARDLRDVLPGADPAPPPLHPPTQQRLVGQRQQRRFVSPVLEEGAVAPVRRALQQARVVRAEP